MAYREENHAIKGGLSELAARIVISPEWAIFDLKGDLDRFTCQRLLQLVANCLSENEKSKLTLGLDQVSYIDQFGIAAILKLKKEIGDRLVIVLTNESILELLRAAQVIDHLREHFTVQPE